MSPYNEDANGNFHKSQIEYNEEVMKVLDIELTTAQLLALNATPIEVIPAPGVGKAIIILGVKWEKPAGTAYAAIDVADDLLLKYINSSGEDLIHCETTGFLDQATKQHRYSYPAQLSTNVAAGLFAITPVENAKVVAHMNNGEVTTGNTSLFGRIYYKIVPMDLSD